MSAIANNPASQSLSVLNPRVQKATEQERFTAVRTIDLNEMPPSAGVAKLFVLVAAPSGSEDDIAYSQSFDGEHLFGSSASTNLFEIFKKTIAQADDRHSASDAVIGDVKVNFITMEAYRRGEPLFLTALEFKTLKYLMTNARRVISRDELLNEVWGYQNYPSTRTVDNQLAKLRKKLEDDPPRPVHLRTVRGVGYKFLP